MDDKAGVEAMLGRLEERYDLEYADLAQGSPEETAEPPALSQDIEDFLKDLNEGFTPPS